MKNNKMSTTLKRQTETDPFVSSQSRQSTKAERSIGSNDIFGSICPLLMFICLYNTSVQEALSGVFCRKSQQQSIHINNPVSVAAAGL